MKTDDAAAAAALDRLRGWDGDLDAASTTASLYQLAHRALVADLFKKALAAVGSGADAAALTWIATGAAFDPTTTLKIQSALQGHLHLNVLRLLERPENWWVATAGGKDALVGSALATAVAELDVIGGADWASDPRCAWGAFHVKDLQHPVSRSLGLAPGTPPLDLPSFPCGGDTNTVNQNACSSFDDLSVATGSQPSLRVVWDLGDVDGGSKLVVVPGQSGQFHSPHYGDQLPAWQAGRLRPLVAAGPPEATTTFRAADADAAAAAGGGCDLM